MKVGSEKRPCQLIENKGKSASLWKTDPVNLLKTNDAVIKSEFRQLKQGPIDR
jgi:hypothetical protein